MAITAAFPDYRWELRNAVVESERPICTTTAPGPLCGVHGDGAQMETYAYFHQALLAGKDPA